MNDPRDYYRVLHVHPDAPTEIIRSSYRTLMQRLKQHPDLGGSHENAALINEAYATLASPERRAEYDRTRSQNNDPTPDPGETGRSEKAGVSWHTYRGLGLGRCGFCEANHDFGADAPEEALCENCGGPLHPAQRHAIQESGLRALERFPKKQVIRYSTAPGGATHSGHTRDISLDGMRFETSQALAVDQMINIQCAVCRAVARVAHAHPEGPVWVVGVEFVTLMFESVQGNFVSAQA